MDSKHWHAVGLILGVEFYKFTDLSDGTVTGNDTLYKRK